MNAKEFFARNPITNPLWMEHPQVEGAVDGTQFVTSSADISELTHGQTQMRDPWGDRFDFSSFATRTDGEGETTHWEKQSHQRGTLVRLVIFND